MMSILPFGHTLRKAECVSQARKIQVQISRIIFQISFFFHTGKNMQYKAQLILSLLVQWFSYNIYVTSYHAFLNTDSIAYNYTAKRSLCVAFIDDCISLFLEFCKKLFFFFFKAKIQWSNSYLFWEQNFLLWEAGGDQL